MCCLLPDPLHWVWTCHADLHTHFFFPGQRPNRCLWPRNVEGQCHTSARSTAKTRGILHVNFHTDHTHKSSSILPPSDTSWSAPSPLTAEGGVLTRWMCWEKSNQWRRSAPSCPKASPLGSASAQVGRKVRYFSCDKSLGKYQVISRQKRLCELMLQLSSDCLEFFWLRLNSFSHSLQKSGSWAAQVPEALSHRIKASGNQKVIFDPQDPWVLVALKAFGTLEDRQKTLKWYKNLSMSYLNLTIEGNKEAVLSNIRKWRQKGRLDRSWEPPTHPFNCPMRKALIFKVEGKNRSSITTTEATSGRAAGRSLQCFQFISRQRRHAGSDGWSSNTPVTRDRNRLWALKWEWIGGGNTTWPTGWPWKTFKCALQIP